MKPTIGQTNFRGSFIDGHRDRHLGVLGHGPDFSQLADVCTTSAAAQLREALIDDEAMPAPKPRPCGSSTNADSTVENSTSRRGRKCWRIRGAKKGNLRKVIATDVCFGSVVDFLLVTLTQGVAGRKLVVETFR